MLCYAGYLLGTAMSPETERWAEAVLAIHLHGDHAQTWVAERIGVLAAAGDFLGVERFRAIARCIDGLLRPESSA